MNTFVTQITDVVKLDSEYVRSQHEQMKASRMLARIEETERRLKAEGRIERVSDWAEGAGLSKGYIGTLKSRLKTGEVKQGKVEEFRKLAAFAKVTVDYLVGDDDTSLDQRETTMLDALKRALIKPDFAPEVASEIARRLEQDHFKATEPLPFAEYWLPRGESIVAEVLGKPPKTIRHPQEGAESTQESEEVRGARKRPRRL